MNTIFAKTATTIAVLGVVTAIATAILYFMRLPIFDSTALAWCFVIGLLGAATAVLALAIRSIWEGSGVY